MTITEAVSVAHSNSLKASWWGTLETQRLGNAYCSTTIPKLGTKGGKEEGVGSGKSMKQNAKRCMHAYVMWHSLLSPNRKCHESGSGGFQGQRNNVRSQWCPLVSGEMSPSRKVSYRPMEYTRAWHRHPLYEATCRACADEDWAMRFWGGSRISKRVAGPDNFLGTKIRCIPMHMRSIFFPSLLGLNVLGSPMSKGGWGTPWGTPVCF